MKPAHLPQFLGLLVDVAADQLVHEHNIDLEPELDIGLVHDVMSVLDEVHNLLPDPLSWSGRKFVEG
eukprot:10104862-Prorocentrum_lima.AAC.1